MNLIDFHVTEVLSEPLKVEQDWGSYWKLHLKYWDDAGEITEWKIFLTEEEALRVKPGYVGQH